MEIIGIVKMFINNRVLGGHKKVEAAVMQGERKETLISIQLLKKWDILHDSFPFQTVSDYIVSKNNKLYQAYSCLINCTTPYLRRVGEKKRIWTQII